MKKWFYRKIRESGREQPPSPLWVRLLWMIGIVSVCGFMYWRYSVTG